MPRTGGLCLWLRDPTICLIRHSRREPGACPVGLPSGPSLSPVGPDVRPVGAHAMSRYLLCFAQAKAGIPGARYLIENRRQVARLAHPSLNLSAEDSGGDPHHAPEHPGEVVHRLKAYDFSHLLQFIV